MSTGEVCMRYDDPGEAIIAVHALAARQSAEGVPMPEVSDAEKARLRDTGPDGYRSVTLTLDDAMVRGLYGQASARRR